ncbi:MAG: hypothetical protein QOI36_3398 [Pseudonocardiales bacterium]|nr:hypothetical protein [Pseudonocardiales bacterium]
MWEVTTPGDRPGLDSRGENMKRYAPLVTLAAVAALGVGLFVANTLNQQGAAQLSASAAIEPASAAAGKAPTVVDLGRLTPQSASPPAATGAEDQAQQQGADAPAVAEKAYAGWSSGKEVSVAIAVKAGRAVAYVCDGKKVEAWLEGTVAGDTLSLESKDGSATINGTVSESSSDGTMTVGGKTWPFTAEGVTAPAGLYEGRADVRGVAARVGWVVSGDGEVTGVASVAGQKRSAPVLNPADPGAVTIDGAPVEVSALDGGSTVIRR